MYLVKIIPHNGLFSLSFFTSERRHSHITYFIIRGGNVQGGGKCPTWEGELSGGNCPGGGNVRGEVSRGEMSYTRHNNCSRADLLLRTKAFNGALFISTTASKRQTSHNKQTFPLRDHKSLTETPATKLFAIWEQKQYVPVSQVLLVKWQPQSNVGT